MTLPFHRRLAPAARGFVRGLPLRRTGGLAAGPLARAGAPGLRPAKTSALAIGGWSALALLTVAGLFLLLPRPSAVGSAATRPAPQAAETKPVAVAAPPAPAPVSAAASPPQTGSVTPVSEPAPRLVLNPAERLPLQPPIAEAARPAEPAPPAMTANPPTGPAETKAAEAAPPPAAPPATTAATPAEEAEPPARTRPREATRRGRTDESARASRQAAAEEAVTRVPRRAARAQGDGRRRVSRADRVRTTASTTASATAELPEGLRPRGL